VELVPYRKGLELQAITVFGLTKYPPGELGAMIQCGCKRKRAVGVEIVQPTTVNLAGDAQVVRESLFAIECVRYRS
jgi:hypothetical protein